MSVAKQAVVSRVVRQDVSDDIVRVVADGGRDERLLRYLDVSGTEGARLLDAVEGASDNRRLVRVLLDEDTPARFQRALARGSRPSTDIDRAEIREVIRMYDSLPDDTSSELARFVGRIQDPGVKFVSRFDSTRSDDLDALERFFRLTETDGITENDLGPYIVRTAGEGADLVRQLDASQLRRLFRVDAGDADGMRARFGKLVDAGEIDSKRVGQFADDAEALRGPDDNYVDGFGNIVDDISNQPKASKIKDTAYEARVGASIGVENIDRMANDWAVWILAVG